MTKTVTITAPAIDEAAETRRAFRQLSFLFLVIASCLGVFLPLIAAIDSAPFYVVAVQIVYLVTFSAAATVAVVAFLASLEGFRGDDAFRSAEPIATPPGFSIAGYAIPTAEHAATWSEAKYEAYITRIIDGLDAQYSRDEIDTQTYNAAFEHLARLDRRVICLCG